MELREAIVAWHDFYVATAGAAAVLLGLVFVAMSLHYDLRNLDRGLIAMATESAVPFFYATLTSLVMLMPVAQPWLPTIGLVVVALLSTLNAGLPIFGGRRAGIRLFDRPFAILVLLAALALIPSAIALASTPDALYAVAVCVLAFVAGGMQNSWNTLLRRDLARPVQRTESGFSSDIGAPADHLASDKTG
jgi:hypothetical protein